MKDLDSMVEGIHYIDTIVMIDEQTGGQLELSGAGAVVSEVVQQIALAVEHLHYAP